MMTPFDQVSLALTVLRRLQRVVTHETAMLRQMKLTPLADLQAEKAALVEAYERQTHQLRATPEIFAALDAPAREAFEQASRELQVAIARNVRALETAREVVEGVVRALGQSLEATRGRKGYAPTSRAAGYAEAPIPLAFSREI